MISELEVEKVLAIAYTLDSIESSPAASNDRDPGAKIW